MHTHNVYENPPALPHDVVAEVLDRALREDTDPGEAADVLVGIALYDDDPEFVEGWCVEVGTRAQAGSPLLGLAGLCLGHTARRFGQLSPKAVALAESLAARSQANPSDVDTRALDGLDDIRWFLFRAE
ncbi:hypothetical protein SAMN05421812_108127 [Asanoa hainanensis]|uniref:Uncharacterized protein n=1 Tax=Asanoa hainanensis TaxID=560556 RepID=A0A239NBP1_9ACTN|nr:hypothetical protein [Asanoa hainanensis]SNT52387.1 hypothetical protein SAMN05421812_108127 [Asanoa hainanensis]